MACLASSLRTAFSLAWPTSRHLPKASLTDASGAKKPLMVPVRWMEKNCARF
ncbi:hypothetical protein FHT76_005784 [Rhizobium sp. BK176]|nr:hypothetical protein [Rhizobium sp. BK176]